MINGTAKAGIQIKGTIDRSEFDLGSGLPSVLISNEAHIKADGEFVSKN